MSDNAQQTVNIGGTTFVLDILKYTKGVSEPNPEKPGKKHIVQREHGIAAPVVKTIDDFTNLFAALMRHAEETIAGTGTKLGLKLLFPQLEAASLAGFNLETGTEDIEAYRAALGTAEIGRSGGMSAEKINEQFSLLGPELAQLASVAASKDGWRTLKDESGTPWFKDQDAYVLRLSEIQRQMAALIKLQEAQAKRSAAANAKREENARKAKEAAAKAASAAASTAVAPTPAA